VRIGLIAAFVFHIHAAASLTIQNRRARPDSYKSKRDYIAADFASRTMRWTGIIIALFIVFHLLDLTWGPANPDFVRGDPYNNLVYSMQRVPVAIVYILANIALAFHLYHGSWSLFQSLGINNPKYNTARQIRDAPGQAFNASGVSATFDATLGILNIVGDDTSNSITVAKGANMRLEGMPTSRLGRTMTRGRMTGWPGSGLRTRARSAAVADGPGRGLRHQSRGACAGSTTTVRVPASLTAPPRAAGIGI